MKICYVLNFNPIILNIFEDNQVYIWHFWEVGLFWNCLWPNLASFIFLDLATLILTSSFGRAKQLQNFLHKFNGFYPSHLKCVWRHFCTCQSWNLWNLFVERTFLIEKLFAFHCLLLIMQNGNLSWWKKCKIYSLIVRFNSVSCVFIKQERFVRENICSVNSKTM